MKGKRPLIEHNGIKKTQADWAREAGISPRLLWERLKRGMGFSEALRSEKRQIRNYNGLSVSHRREYSVWLGMKHRCLDPNSVSGYRYCKRGITICERWLQFENFLEDMGSRPEGCQIDRIDNSKGYYKENCRWVTPSQQQNNRSSNIILEHNGEKKTATEWARIAGYSNVARIFQRIKRGWSMSQILGYEPPPGRVGWGHKLNPQKAKLIRDRLKSGETNCNVAREFGVSSSLISKIRTGELWNIDAA